MKTAGHYQDIFLTQADWCEKLGSPYTAALLIGLADEIGRGSALDRLLSGLGKMPSDAVVALRFTGALHALGVWEKAQALMPHSSRAAWDAKALSALAIKAFEDNETWTTEFIQNAPQTNEVRRAAALITGFAHVATGAPMHMLEVGASAGLNLYWDKFSYQLGEAKHQGEPNAPLIDSDWQGPSPDLSNVFNVASRAGCDLNVIDIKDPAMRQMLMAYIWPDQEARKARFRAAMDIALKYDAKIDQMGAADWLEDKLKPPLPEGITIIYHSIAWQYFDTETHRRALATIEAAGEKADAGHRLAWVRMERSGFFDGEDGVLDQELSTRQWPGGQTLILAEVDPHLNWIRHDGV